MQVNVILVLYGDALQSSDVRFGYKQGQGYSTTMLKICYGFAQSNSIICNNKKTVCIKFGKEIVKNEKAVLNTHVLKRVDKVKHLGNYMDKDCNKVTDCNFKSLFIGYVNTLQSNFGEMQPSTLISLLKSYCCSFYGSHLWKFNSSGFDKCCKSWNIAVRILLGFHFNAHVYLLGPLACWAIRYARTIICSLPMECISFTKSYCFNIYGYGIRLFK